MTPFEVIALSCPFAMAWGLLYVTLSFWADESTRAACEAVTTFDAVPLMRSAWP